MLNLPDHPLVGDTFTSPSGAIYRWDGRAWTITLEAGAPFLPLAGGQMLGSLKLAGDPLEYNEAATRSYVDMATASALSTTAWTALASAGALQTTDAVIIGRADGSLVQSTMANFATRFGPYLVDALGLAGASAYGLAIYSIVISTDGLTATINGRTLDNGLHAGVQYSFDSAAWQTPSASNLAMIPSGTGDSFALTMSGLAGKYWRLYLRLVANNPTVVQTEYFPIGTAATIGFSALGDVNASEEFSMFGYIGQATSYITGMLPILSARNFGIYQGATLSHGQKWFGNLPIQAPARGGTYLLRVINSSEAFDPFHYPPYDSALVVHEPLLPTLWMEPVPTAPPNNTYSKGPYTWVGQWGFSQPPFIQYRASGGVHGFDTGWVTPSPLTINPDGSISTTLPKYDTTTTPPMPADNGYTGLQWRRGDNTAITTHLYAMQP